MEESSRPRQSKLTEIKENKSQEIVVVNAKPLCLTS